MPYKIVSPTRHARQRLSANHHVGAPSIAWSNYSKHAKTYGLSPRTEFVAGADRIHGLAEAMRLFEIHEDQVGLLIFVADSLATAFIVSHPEDYRRLHSSVLQDFLGEVFVHHARYAEIGHMDIDLDATGVDSLDALAAACDVVDAKWHEQAELLANGLVDQPLKSEAIHRLGPFELERFMTDVSDLTEAHIAETIVHSSGALQYLKTYRLSKNQIKRAHLLEQLAAHDWQIEALATAQGKDSAEIVRRMHNVGFGYLLNPEVVRRATRRRSQSGPGWRNRQDLRCNRSLRNHINP